MGALTIPPAPSPGERFKELLVEKFGWGGCKHAFIVVQRRDGLFLRCTKCPHETEGFTIARERQ
jgi:hypothetical protein